MLKKLTTTTIFLIFLIFETNVTKAQGISLLVNPPILEAIVKPGEKIEQVYTLKNEGPSDVILSVDIFTFSQADEFGNPRISKSIKYYDPLSIKNWFSFKEPQITLGDRFSVRQGEEKKIVLEIKPENNTPDGDYYFTLIFRSELDNTFITPESKGSMLQAEIGSNILISISKDGLINKKASIKEFKAPKIVDSFSTLTYQVKIANIGDGYFKPQGQITVESILGKKYTLNLAPQNIIANSSREIYCLENETLIPCRLPIKFLFGPYKATLSFTAEDNPIKYKKTLTSFGLPITPILVISFVLLFFVILKKPKK
jgi:hypothetical protein